MTKIITDEKQIDKVLERGIVDQVLPTKEEFKKRLLSGERLKFYIGFDATAPNLHLSHAKNFMLLEEFRKLGHEVIVLFGDFTARIGDPSGEDSARKQLTREEVMNNVEKWKQLIQPLMDFDSEKNPPKIMYNHDWLSKLTFEDVISLAGNFTVQQMLERDMFEKRLGEGKPIHLHEFFYPLMQGYDSVAMDVDVEMCGTDQIFNALAGRTLLRKMKDKEKFVVAVTLMENPKTGELMSKSKGTGVFLDVSADDMYGQVMAQPDEMIEVLFVNCTRLGLDEIAELKISENPRDTKMRLAWEITNIFHGQEVADQAQEDFANKFQKRDVEIDAPVVELEVGENFVSVLTKTGLAESNADAKRKIKQGGVSIEGTKIDFETDVEEAMGGKVLKVGKKDFRKIKITK